MKTFQVNEIGVVRKSNGETRLEIDGKYRQMFTGLESYSHINVIWWFSENDNEDARSLPMVHPNHNLELPLQGIFATRSPKRPNPVALSAVKVLKIDFEACVIWIDDIEAFDGTPVIDIKPYIPEIDSIPEAKSPCWPRRSAKN